MFKVKNIFTSNFPSQVIDTLRELDESFIFYQPPGNIGDYLLEIAAIKIFTDLGLHWEMFHDKSDLTGRVVIIGGSGNLTTDYCHVEDFIHHITGFPVKQIIILPSSTNYSPKILLELRECDIFFSRDSQTHAYLSSLPLKCQLIREHDVAFYLKSDDLKKLANDYSESGKDDTTPSRLKYFMRSDVESAVKIRDYYQDLSIEDAIIFDLGSKRVVLCRFLFEIEQSNFILTDRLHIGVVASIFQVPCLLIDNNYGKNLHVYEQSLKSNNYILCIGAPLGRLLLSIADKFRTHEIFLDHFFGFLLTIKPILEFFRFESFGERRLIFKSPS